MYQKVYVATHTNADCYLTGFVVGFYHKKLKQTAVDLMKSKVKCEKSACKYANETSSCITIKHKRDDRYSELKLKHFRFFASSSI